MGTILGGVAYQKATLGSVMLKMRTGLGLAGSWGQLAAAAPNSLAA